MLISPPITGSTARLVRTFGPYQLLDIYQKDVPDLHQSILDLWARNAILPPGESPDIRIKQAILVVLNQRGEAIGVNTAYETTLQNLECESDITEKYYAYRTFLEPRISWEGLPRIMLANALEILDSIKCDTKPSGLLIKADNPRIASPILTRAMLRHHFQMLGTDAYGRPIFERTFDKAK